MKTIFMLMSLNQLNIMNMPPEDDEGGIEYKLTLENLTDKQLEHRASQLQYRLESSQYGQAIYMIGVLDDGFAIGLTREEMNHSLENMKKIVSMVEHADISSIEETEVKIYAKDLDDLKHKFIVNPRFQYDPDNVIRKRALNENGKEAGLEPITQYVAEIIIRQKIGEYWEIKVAIAGNVDCGKSTLLGVLTSGQYDNGRGSARLNVMKHKHETSTGRTSCIGQEIVGFDERGNSVNNYLSKLYHGKHEWSDIVRSSKKIVTFFDLPGHLDYFPQAIKGLTSNHLDYAIVTIGANMSSSVDADKGTNRDWINMTTEHLSVILTLGIQCIIVITKIDSTPSDVTENTISRIDKLIKKKYATYKINDVYDVHHCVRLMEPGNIVPIIKVSNVTGEGHDSLKKLLVLLPPKHKYINTSPPVLQIQEIFHKVEGTSIVIAGQLISGVFLFSPSGKNNHRLKIGPLHNGEFLETRVRSLQCKRMDVSRVEAGRYVCIGLPKNDEVNQQITKGMFALGAEMNPKVVWEFWLYTRLVKTRSTHIKVGYTPHCHIGHIKQTCKVIGIYKWNAKWTGEKSIAEHFINPIPEYREEDNAGLVTIKHPDFVPIERLSAGDHALLLVRFCFKPELIFEHNRSLVFREQKIKGAGEIIEVTDVKHTAMNNQDVTKAHKSRLSRRERREQYINQRNNDKYVKAAKEARVRKAARPLNPFNAFNPD